MAKLELLKVEVTPSKMCNISESLKFDLVFNNQAYLPDDVEFDVIYIGDTYNESRDQKLSTNVIGPLEAGKLCFNIDTTPVDVTKIPINALFGLTTILIVAKYHEQQFLRIGYVVDVKHEGVDSEKLIEEDQQSEEEENEEEDDENEEGDDNEDDDEDIEIIDDKDLEDDDEKVVDEQENEEDECCSNKNDSCCKEGECEENECCSEGECSETDSNAENLENAISEVLKPKKRAEVPFETPIVAGTDEFEYKGLTLNQSKIELHFLEKPIIQVFEIDWCNEAKEEAIVDSSEEEVKEDSVKKQKVE